MYLLQVYWLIKEIFLSHQLCVLLYVSNLCSWNLMHMLSLYLYCICFIFMIVNSVWERCLLILGLEAEAWRLIGKSSKLRSAFINKVLDLYSKNPFISYNTCYVRFLLVLVSVCLCLPQYVGGLTPTIGSISLTTVWPASTNLHQWVTCQ